MDWPKQAKVVQVTARNATLIRKAFDESIDVDAVVAAWDESHPDKESMTTSMARSWALANVHTKKKPLEAALSRLYADGYTLGDSIARSRLLSMVVKSVSAHVVDWSTWTPGMESSAALVRPTGGLQELLRTRKIQVTDEILRTKLDRIGTRLADSLEQGYSAERTAAAIRDVVNDPQHAMVIARTEMARSMSVATRDTYEKSNVEQVEWLVAEGCDDCQENADASPIGINETFPTGDSEPPAHPNCMCAIAPVFDDSNLPEASESEVMDAEQDIESVDTGSAFEEVEQEAPIEPEYPESLPLEEVLNIAKPGTSPIVIGKGDVWLSEIQDRLGFNGLPTLVNSEQELNALVDKGWTKMYRGIARGEGLKEDAIPRALQDFKTGPNYAGEGMYGNGTYASTELNRAVEYAKDKPENVLHMALSPDAKTIDYAHAQTDRKKELLALYEERGYKDGNEFFKASPHEYEIVTDLGRWAASKGYDAITTRMFLEGGDIETYYVILNRTKVAVIK